MKFFNALFLLFFLSDAYASEVESVFSKKSKSSWVLESAHSCSWRQANAMAAGLIQLTSIASGTPS
jgi:hypothetical protein